MERTSWNMRGVIVVTDDKYKVLVALLLKGMVCQANTKISDDPFIKEYEDSLYLDNADEIFAFLRLTEPDLYCPRLMQAIRHRKYVEGLLKDREYVEGLLKEERSEEDGISGVSDR